jgi:hypothetical protein
MALLIAWETRLLRLEEPAIFLDQASVSSPASSQAHERICTSGPSKNMRFGADALDPELHTTAPGRGKTYSDHELLRATDLRQRLAAPALSDLDESQKKGI